MPSEAKYDKRRILDAAVAGIQSVIDDANKQVQKFQDEAAGYPSAMESHSDTNRCQNQRMAEAARRTSSRLSEGFGDIQSLPEGWCKEPHTTAKLYSLVETMSEDGEKMVVFLVPGSATAEVSYQYDSNSDPITVYIVPEKAGIAVALIGKTLGEIIQVGRHKRRITWLG